MSNQGSEYLTFVDGDDVYLIPQVSETSDVITMLQASETSNITEPQFAATGVESMYKWTHQNTLLLLDLYKKYKTMVTEGRIWLKKLYECIANEIKTCYRQRNVHPVLLLSTEIVQELDISSKESVDAVELEESTPQTPKTSLHRQHSQICPVKKTKTYQSRKLKCTVLQEIRNDRREFYRQMLDIERNKLKVRAESNRLLRKKLMKKNQASAVLALKN
nr:unnamed protein product [Callosobruchus analis]